jgi:hypothetical protein
MRHKYKISLMLWTLVGTVVLYLIHSHQFGSVLSPVHNGNRQTTSSNQIQKDKLILSYPRYFDSISHSSIDRSSKQSLRNTSIIYGESRTSVR